MAKVKFSALISEMRNKLNGSVFSKNRAGNYLRNKVTPVNPQSDAQVEARSRLAQFSQGWRSLTEAQRNAWIGAVDNWTTTDIFGDTVKPSGNNLYTKLNANIALAGGVAISVPPAPTGATALTSLSIAPDSVTPEFIIDFAATPVPANHSLVIEATAPQSPGINFFKSKYRVILVAPAATASGLNVITQYTAKFGNLIAGQKVSVRCKMINTLTGEVSQALTASEIIS